MCTGRKETKRTRQDIANSDSCLALDYPTQSLCLYKARVFLELAYAGTRVPWLLAFIISWAFCPQLPNHGKTQAQRLRKGTLASLA